MEVRGVLLEMIGTWSLRPGPLWPCRSVGAGGVRWSLILVVLDGFDRRRFERDGCLGDFRHRREPAQLVHGDDEVGARRWLNFMAVDLDEGVV